MKIIAVVETFEEALIKAGELGLIHEGKEPFQLIKEVNELIVYSSIAMPCLPTVTEDTIRDLEVNDIITLREESTAEHVDYRIMNQIKLSGKEYLVLIPLVQEKEPEYDLFFYRYEGGVSLIPLDEEEWVTVEQVYNDLMGIRPEEEGFLNFNYEHLETENEM